LMQLQMKHSILVDRPFDSRRNTSPFDENFNPWTPLIVIMSSLHDFSSTRYGFEKHKNNHSGQRNCCQEKRKPAGGDGLLLMN
ncbi:MAG: hypothetical protein NTY61_03705, partial [Candidatus Parcubacteria bacterium]|nr:hypothetical protein [Candidatus Parcubacteria bacterium]